MQVQSLNRSNVTVLRTLQQPTRPVTAAPMLQSPSALGFDQLTLSQRPQSVKQMTQVGQPTTDALSPPDFEGMFTWVEKVTGKPIAYQTPASRQAYIKYIQGKPQEYYDKTGFLASLGVHNAISYGRDEQGMQPLLKTIKYTPNSGEVSWGLRLLQKGFYKMYLHTPKLFGVIAKVVDKHILTKKDVKEKPWLNAQLPLPGLGNSPLVPPTQIWNNYGKTKVAEYLNAGIPIPPTQSIFEQSFGMRKSGQVSFLFESDFHMGVPKPGENPQNYGTYAIARKLGFSHEQATRFGTADFDLDLNKSPYGMTDSFPKSRSSRHFNVNKFTPAGGDTRFVWAQKHLDAAVELAKRGRFDQAEMEVGYGLHSIQDSFAHGHISLSSHAVTDDIPDGVDHNPVATVEATVATIGYLNKYMERILQLKPAS